MDEIPVARRSKAHIGALRNLSAGFKIFLFVLFASISSLLFVQRLLPDLFGTSSLEVTKTSSELDGRLLGHFPYPEASSLELVNVSSGIQLHVDAAEAYNSMIEAARQDEVDLRLLSGYRSHQLQEEIFFDIKSERNQTARERAKVSAPPGYSEHSTGYAIDLGDGTRPETHFRENFQSTKAFRWLEANAARYHFVLSFPPQNSQGVTYEPWHWRYEGTAEALRKFEASRQFSQR